MEIIVVTPTLRAGGAQRVVSTLTREWAKSHQVTIVIFDASNKDYAHGGRIIDLRLPASDSLLSKVYNLGARSGRLAYLLRRRNPDRVISFTESANLPAIVASALVGCLDKLCVSIHCNPDTLSFPYRVVIPLLYRFASGVIAVSAGVKQGLASMGLPSAKLSTIPNPVEIRNWHGSLNQSAPPMQGQFILGVGRLHQVKGFDRLLQALCRLNRPKIQLVILGEGSERLNLGRLASEFGVERMVHLPGHVADVDPWYRRAECFVLSSRSEAWPNVLMEAMVNGCPVVSFDVRHGPSEIIEHGESGLLVPEGDVEALAEAIARILDEVELRHRLVAKGRERVQDYCVQNVAQRWLAGH